MKKRLTMEVEKESSPSMGFSAFCRELSGCFSNGVTKEEAVKNIREAIALHLESLRSEGNPQLSPNELTVPQLAKFLRGQCFVPLRKSGSHLTVFKTIYEGKHPIRNVMITLPVHEAPHLGRKLTLRILREAGYSTEGFSK